MKNLLLLIMLRLQGRMGRYRLKNMLDLSEREGVVRLMLDDLKREGYIEAGKTGCGLTERGKTLLQTLLERYGIVTIKDMDLRSLGLEGKCFVIHIRGRQAPKKIIELRDHAVRAGADGVVLIDNEEGRLRIPTVYDDLDLDYPTAVEKLHKTFDLSIGDILLIGLSKDRWRALEGALAAAMEIK